MLARVTHQMGLSTEIWNGFNSIRFDFRVKPLPITPTFRWCPPHSMHAACQFLATFQVNWKTRVAFYMPSSSSSSVVCLFVERAYVSYPGIRSACESYDWARSEEKGKAYKLPIFIVSMWACFVIFLCFFFIPQRKPSPDNRWQRVREDGNFLVSVKR